MLTISNPNPYHIKPISHMLHVIDFVTLFRMLCHNVMLSFIGLDRWFWLGTISRQFSRVCSFLHTHWVYHTLVAG